MAQQKSLKHWEARQLAEVSWLTSPDVCAACMLGLRLQLLRDLCASLEL